MDAGRDLDALVAERVMGWQRKLLAGRFYWFGPYDGRVHARMNYDGARLGDSVPLAFAEDSDHERFAPSTDISAAWQVVEHMHARGFHIVLWFDDMVTGMWGARFLRGLSGRDRSDDGSTAPLAICRAALAAVGAEVPA